VTGPWEVSPRYPGAAATIAEVWRHRGLVGFIAERALRRMYRRTVLGWLWLIINPLVPLTLRVLIFGVLLGVASNGVPYFLFLLAGTVVWDVFAGSLMRGTRALEMNRDLTEQIYYPRALLPFGNIAPAMLDLIIKIAVLGAALAYYAARDGRLYLRSDPAVLWAIAALGLALLFALSISFFTAVWGEAARDTRFALGQLLSIWYLLTPVLYPISGVPEQYRGWMLLNPMALIAETFKWALFGVGEFLPRSFAATAAAVVLLFSAGLVYFTRAEARTIDER
jgi:lipopolysaccharide transport system permease protein